MALALSEVLSTLIAPLIVADQGELFVGQVDSKLIRLHLRGRFSGCPGNTLAIQRVIEPALRKAAPSAVIEISAGELVPEGTVLWTDGSEGDG
jgi:Fe-S cluster biogenesis protein NfuA